MEQLQVGRVHTMGNFVCVHFKLFKMQHIASLWLTCFFNMTNIIFNKIGKLAPSIPFLLFCQFQETIIRNWALKCICMSRFLWSRALLLVWYCFHFKLGPAWDVCNPLPALRIVRNIPEYYFLRRDVFLLWRLVCRACWDFLTVPKDRFQLQRCSGGCGFWNWCYAVLFYNHVWP